MVAGRYSLLQGKVRLIALVGLLALLGFALLTVSGCASGEDRSRDVWRGIQQHLSAADVSKVQFWGPGDGTSGAVAEPPAAVVAALISGTFAEDNPNHFGPTPEVGVTFVLKQGDPLNVAQWPDGRFEIARNGRQFLVSAPELAFMLTEAGFVYR